MYFPSAFEKMFLANGGLATTGTSANLTPGQIGLYDFKLNTVVAAPPGAGTNQVVYLAQGSFHTTDKIGPFAGGYQESVKSKGINPRYVTKFFKSLAQTPLNQILSIGWDMTAGNDGTSPQFQCNKTYNLRLDAKGSPVLRFLNHQLYHTFLAYTGCCAGNCNQGCTGALVDPATVMLQWADAINSQPIVSQFVQAQVYVQTPAQESEVQNLSGTPEPVGGTIATGNVTYKVSAVGIDGEGIPSAAIVVPVVGPTGAVNLNWTLAADPTATYKIYNVTTGHYFTVGAGVSAFTDTGAAGTAGTPPAVPGSNGATAVQTATYVPKTDAADIANVNVGLQLTVAYVDTVFQNCSFEPTDHYELEPIFLYPSFVDESGDSCAPVPNLPITTIQAPKQMSGSGETVIRDYILTLRYMQEPFQENQRLREVLNDISLTSGIDRTTPGLYDIYGIVHSVPRFNNPSAIFDNDQYFIKIVVPTGTNMTSFITLVEGLLSAAGNSITLEDVNNNPATV